MFNKIAVYSKLALNFSKIPNKKLILQCFNKIQSPLYIKKISIHFIQMLKGYSNIKKLGHI